MALTYKQIQEAAKKKGLDQSAVNMFAKAKGVAVPKTETVYGKEVVSSDINKGYTKTNPIVKNAASYGLESGYAVKNKPSVATPATPVVSRDTKPGSVVIPDYSDIKGLDQAGLKDYIDAALLSEKIGNKISYEDAYKVSKAQQLYSDMLNQPKDTANPYKDLISEEEKARQQREAELAAQREQRVAQYGNYLTTQTEQQIEQARRNAEREQQAQQSASSFSGFGRSTFNQQEIADIQQRASQAIAGLEEAKRLELDRYRAEQEGADADTLAAYDAQINNYKAKAAEWEQSAITKANELNAATSASYEEKVQNLLASAMDTAKTFEDLTDEEKTAIQGFAGVILDDKGNIDANVLKSIPAGLSAYVINEASKLRKNLPGGAAETVTVGSGKNARVYQWNPETGTYDIPVGSSGSGGGGGGAGVGNGGLTSVPKENRGLVDLLLKYKNILGQNTALGLALSPEKRAVADNLVSQITAEYKQAKKLGTLDAGVQKLIDGLIGKGGGLLNPSTYSTTAQSKAVDSFLISLGYNVAEPQLSNTTINQSNSNNNDPLGLR